MRWRSDTQHGVRSAGISHELHLAAGLSQRDKHLLTLTNRTALVGLALHDQRRRPAAVRERRWRMRRERLTRLVWCTAPLNRAPDMRNIARSVHRLQVETRRPTYRRFEPIGVADRPGGHVTTVAVAPDASPFR